MEGGVWWLLLDKTGAKRRVAAGSSRWLAATSCVGLKSRKEKEMDMECLRVLVDFWYVQMRRPMLLFIA